MFSKYRVFASLSQPYINQLHSTETISITTQEGTVMFRCPPASSWRGSDGVHKLTLDLTDSSEFSPPNAELDYTENKYDFANVFQRDWSLMGSVLTAAPIAICTLSVNIVRIPVLDVAGIYNNDHLNKVCPSIVKNISSAGLLNGADRRYAYTSNYREKGNGRAQNHRWFYTLSKEDLLVFDFHFSYSPDVKRKSYLPLKSFTELMFDTFSIGVDQDVLNKRHAILAQHAEGHGGIYDPDDQSIWVPLNTLNYGELLTENDGNDELSERQLASRARSESE